jgi:endonuclease/exonuclease/phosphatase family metal-dependent hydrolase
MMLNMMHLLSLLLSLLAVVSLHAESPLVKLRVMNFNIRYSGGQDGARSWKNRQELCTATVRAFDPDLLGTQEVLADQYDDLLRLFPDYTIAGVAREDGVRKGEWAAILYRTARFEPLASGNFWLSETPDRIGSKGWDAAEPRICTWVRLRDRITGRTLLHANIHFDHRGVTARARSAELLASRLPLLAEQGPVILTGDFNDDEDGDAYRTLLHPSAAPRLTLADTYREVYPKRTPDEATFHDFKGTVAGSRIDWILHTPHWTAASAGIIHPEGDRYPSDHFPVAAVLEWKP